MNLGDLIIILLHAIHISHSFVQRKNCQLTKIDSQKGIFKLIGFFPITDEQTDISIHAVAWSEAMKYEINKGNKWYNNSDMIGYTLYDTCSSNLDVVTEAMMEVLLARGPELYFGCSCIEKNIPLFRTIGIVGPALSTNTRYVNQLVLYEKVPVISYASTSPELGDKKKYPYFYRTSPPDTYQAQFVKDVLVRFNWLYVSILASDDIYGRYGIQYLSEEFLDIEICTGLEETFSIPIVKQELHSHMRKLSLDSMANVIILWGYFSSVKAILEIAYEHGLHNKTWIISEASGRNSWFASSQNKLKGTFLIIEADGGHDEEFEQHFLNLTYKDSEHNPWLRALFHSHEDFDKNNRSKTLQDIVDLDDIGSRVGYVQKAVKIYIHAFLAYMQETAVCYINDNSCEIPSIIDHGSFSEKYVAPATFIDDNNLTYYFDLDGTIMDAAFDILKVTNDDNEENFVFVLHWCSARTIHVINSSLVESLSNISAHCSKPCQPGYHRFYNNFKECCWKCIQCPLDSITITKNKTHCEKCAKNHISNTEKTQCLPLKSKYIYYLSSKAYVIYIMSSIGILLTLPIAITFIAARNTPVIRSSRLYLSLGQLFIHLLLFLIPALFLGVDSRIKCISRAYGITTSFVLIIALSITKINHIVTVFNLKYRLTKWKMIKLQTVEFMIVFICIVIKFCLSVILFQFKPVNMIEHIERTTAELSEKCDIVHYEYQVGFIMILEIICGIQAFRGRKLPTNYNEAKYVTFAMFTSSLITVTGIPLTLSMPDINDQNLIIAILTILSNISILLILFGYKIVIIWIYPNYNSVEVFQRERMEKVVSETDKRLSTVTCYSIDSITERNKAFVLSILEEQERKRKLGSAVEFHKTSFYKRAISSKQNNQSKNDDDCMHAYENQLAIELNDDEDFSSHYSDSTSTHDQSGIELNNEDDNSSQFYYDNDDDGESQADTTYSYDNDESTYLDFDQTSINTDEAQKNHPSSHVNESYNIVEEDDYGTAGKYADLPPIIHDGDYLICEI